MDCLRSVLRQLAEIRRFTARWSGSTTVRAAQKPSHSSRARRLELPSWRGTMGGKTRLVRKTAIEEGVFCLYCRRVDRILNLAPDVIECIDRSARILETAAAAL